MGNFISVVTADDSYVVRSLLEAVFEETEDIRIVGMAANGVEALEQIEKHKPDILILDMEMPVMDGLETLTRLQKIKHNTRIIILSTLTSKFAPLALKALALGATTYIQKPSTQSNKKSIDEVGDELTDLIRSIAGAQKSIPQKKVSQVQNSSKREILNIQAPTIQVVQNRPVNLIVIASSTGGPNALSELFKSLHPDFRIPIVVVQHMPKLFIPQLAIRLTKDSGKRVKTAEHGEPIIPGTIYLSPGEIHTKIKKKSGRLVIELDDGPPEVFCKPSANPLFRSASAILKNNVLGLVLTGMGEDGFEGAGYLAKNGGGIIIQNKESCVIWGMPAIIQEYNYESAAMELKDMGSFVSKLKLRSDV